VGRIAGGEYEGLIEKVTLKVAFKSVKRLTVSTDCCLQVSRQQTEAQQVSSLNLL